jgi:hypothetical protein
VADAGAILDLGASTARSRYSAARAFAKIAESHLALSRTIGNLRPWPEGACSERELPSYRGSDHLGRHPLQPCQVVTRINAGHTWQTSAGAARHSEPCRIARTRRASRLRTSKRTRTAQPPTISRILLRAGACIMLRWRTAIELVELKSNEVNVIRGLATRQAGLSGQPWLPVGLRRRLRLRPRAHQSPP